MRTLTNFSLSIIAAVAVATTAFAGGHGGGLPASVKARKAHMTLSSHNIGILASMAKGEADYDADAAMGAAQNLAALAALNQSTYWEPGTDSDSVDGSRALPALWENIPDAIAKSQALNEAAVALASTAGDGLEAVQAGLGPVGKACGACHEDYRKPNN